MNKIKLAVVDDNSHFRQAIARFLNAETDLTVVTEATDGLDLLQKLDEKAVDIILMDIRMPKMDGIAATHKVLELFPNSKIIAHSQYDFEANILKMYSLGVKCFISKGCNPDELMKAIRIVYKGGIYITEDFSSVIKKGLLNNGDTSTVNQFNLSEKEMELLQLIMKGYSSKEIGERFNKSHRTIEDYREKIYNKLGVKNKLELIAMVHKLN